MSGDITPQGEIAITIEEDNSFEINFPDTALFQAQFSEDGLSASGVYELMSKFEASEAWELSR